MNSPDPEWDKIEYYWDIFLKDFLFFELFRVRFSSKVANVFIGPLKNLTKVLYGSKISEFELISNLLKMVQKR